MKASEVKAWSGNTYQALAARTMPSKDPLKAGLHGVLGLQAEIQEFLDADETLEPWYRRMCSPWYHELSDPNRKSFDKEYRKVLEHCQKELGDIWWMIAEICTANGIALDDLFKSPDPANIDVLESEPYTRCAAMLAGIYQKHFQGHEISKKRVFAILKELLKSFIIATEDFGDYNEIWQMNIEKLEARYPDGFDPDRSMHRAEGDI